MAKFKVIVSDPEESKSKVVELEGTRAIPLIGRRLGEIIDGVVVGLSGYKLKITGGSDKDGFPMRHNIHGGIRVSVMVSKGVGFRPKREGERQRKTLRGNVITEEIVQVNMKIVEKPRKTEKPKKEKKAKSEVEGTTEDKREKETEILAEIEPAQVAEATESGGEPSEKAS